MGASLIEDIKAFQKKYRHKLSVYIKLIETTPQRLNDLTSKMEEAVYHAFGKYWSLVDKNNFKDANRELEKASTCFKKYYEICIDNNKNVCAYIKKQILDLKTELINLIDAFLSANKHLLFSNGESQELAAFIADYNTLRSELKKLTETEAKIDLIAERYMIMWKKIEAHLEKETLFMTMSANETYNESNGSLAQSKQALKIPSAFWGQLIKFHRKDHKFDELAIIMLKAFREGNPVEIENLSIDSPTRSPFRFFYTRQKTAVPPIEEAIHPQALSFNNIMITHTPIPRTTAPNPSPTY